jgi:hypothetical protein
MLTLGALSFASPWLLAALAALPVLWWLLRLIPPAPRHQRFPAIRLLMDLVPREETPDRTPLWLLILRLLLAALVILGLAQPILNAPPRFAGSGPLLLVVDDGWAAGPDWAARIDTLNALVDQAERENLPIVLLPTAPPADGGPVAASGLMPAGEARDLLRALQPKPWASDRAAADAALDRLQLPGSPNVYWLSDGLAGLGEADVDLAEHLQRLGRLTLLAVPAESLPLLMRPPAAEADGLTATLLRATPDAGRGASVRATAEDGRTLAVAPVTFAGGETSAQVSIDLPMELRNRVTRLAIEGQDSAGAVFLLDESWRQRPVGLVSGGAQHDAQPLLSDLYYLDRALEPVSEVREGAVLGLLERELAVLVLADVGTLTEPEQEQVEAWVQNGGVLVRFAGPRLAQNADSLLPVRLRAGDRVLGGVMSWAQPAALAPFPEDGPFAGLPVPADVRVERQVLAEPDPDLGSKTWARLADGTPLVTGSRHGDGWLVLVHTTANADWSNLALSGLFVEMLQRTVGLSEGVSQASIGAADGERSLTPLQTLDGFGRLAEPPPTALPAPVAAIAAGTAGPQHPPGFYGQPTSRMALNLSTGIAAIAPLGPLPAGVARETLARAEAFDLMPWLLAAALLLLIADMAIALWLRGLGPASLRAARRSGSTAAILLLVAGVPMLSPLQVRAQDGSAAAGDADAFALAAVEDTRLAYVRTGVPSVDATSRAGLQGLGLILNQRTSVETLPPLAVDIETDELVFFPLLYWPVVPEQPLPSDAALRRVNEYLKNGGSVLFDTRDHGAANLLGAVSASTERLRQLARGLDVPPLVAVPPDHVLTKSFYLMQEFPGRWADGQVWVEGQESGVNDGVSPVIIGGNDWAAAWAVDDLGRAMFPVVPGGERQREMAYRFGVNLVMYVLTGNYKSDQVHVPAILERLGQ